MIVLESSTLLIFSACLPALRSTFSSAVCGKGVGGGGVLLLGILGGVVTPGLLNPDPSLE